MREFKVGDYAIWHEHKKEFLRIFRVEAHKITFCDMMTDHFTGHTRHSCLLEGALLYSSFSYVTKGFLK
jgi:hypothetical protein